MFGRVQRDDRGAAAVEFALVSVLLFTLLFGIIQYGFLFFQYQAAAATVHDAARKLVTGPTATTFVSGIGQSGCPPFFADLKALGQQNGLPANTLKSAAITVESAGPPIQRGSLVKLTLTIEPTPFHVPFVPMPADLDVSAVGTVEAVGAITDPCNQNL